MPTFRPPFVSSWCAQRWLESIEGFGDLYARRLRASQTDKGYQRIYPLLVRPGLLSAQASDRYGYAYQVRIEVDVLPESVWAQTFEALTSEAGYLALLLAHAMPPQVERIVEEAGGLIFPRSPDDLRCTCRCYGSWHAMCRHIAAVHTAFARRLESQPELLLTLWGREPEHLAALVRERWAALAREMSGRAAAPGEEEVAARAGLPARVRPADFFTASASLEEFDGAITMPQRKMALLRRLGHPPFASEGEDITAALTPVYDLAMKRALQAWERSGVARSTRNGRPRAPSTTPRVARHPARADDRS
ncbi:MAG: hypothetical protein IVW57_04830 [Ktedonobacterales bacterium]|nr:hypothetical protein [Ktedonobacterales bacterium]